MSANDPKRTFQSIASDARAAKHVQSREAAKPSALALAKPAAGQAAKFRYFFRTGI
jgi:hypothetical protein